MELRRRVGKVSGARAALALSAGVGVLVAAATAGATYSVAAVDSEQMWVGGAGTSCVGSLQVSVIQALVPGVGVVHAQALLSTAGRDQAQVLLQGGASPQEVIDAIASPSFDPQFEQRQYAVVDLQGRSAAFTGSQNGQVALDSTGQQPPFTYSVQGNILTSAGVVNNSIAGFEDAAGCDLPARLMRALETGAQNQEGDSRCTGGGIPSDSAFLRVVDAQGADLIFLEVTNTAPNSPLVELRAQFDDWRVTHPCPDVPGDGDGDGEGDGDGDGDADSGESGDVEAGEASSSSDAGDEGATGSADVDTGSATEAGPETGAGSDSGSTTQPESSGCACIASARGSGGGAALGLLFLTTVRRRRRRTSR